MESSLCHDVVNDEEGGGGGPFPGSKWSNTGSDLVRDGFETGLKLVQYGLETGPMWIYGLPYWTTLEIRFWNGLLPFWDTYISHKIGFPL